MGSTDDARPLAGLLSMEMATARAICGLAEDAAMSLCVVAASATGMPGGAAFFMYQVTFSEQAMRELNRLDQLVQLDLVAPISNLTGADLAHPREPLGRFHRSGKEFYRLRAGDYRFYFDSQGETLHVNYILHKNSLEDFLLRNKLPVSEQQLAEQHSKFWKYLESLARK